MPDPRYYNDYFDYIDKIRAYGVQDDGQPSFLREWEPVGYLGQGSYGVVYEIWRGRERCAVKIIDMSKPEIDYSVEINALNMLKGHKHATNIYEYAYVSIRQGGFTNRYLLIRMNLLSDLPESLTEDEVIDLGAQICDVLSVCHSGETRLYHCDIKPENILVAGDGSYVLSDFGASNITQRSHKSSGHAGTPLYEAPEMLKFEEFDGRSDLFSLGITMYALLNNGLPPFARNDNDPEAIRIRLEGKRIPAIEGVSPELIKIIRKACAPNPDRRYNSAAEMKNALDTLKQEREKSKIQPPGEDKDGDNVFGKTSAPGENVIQGLFKKAKRRPFAVIATAAALVAAIVCGAAFLPGLGSGVVKLNENVSVGDHVYFGSYPQTADGEVQPIEWRVLDIEDGNALMISEYLLDVHKFDDYSNDWESSELRAWLNEDFINTAFSTAEQQQLGEVDGDKVTCLSVDEVKKYFSNTTKEQDSYTTIPDRMAAPTAYAKKNGAYVFSKWGTGWWWLRSPGSSSGLAPGVNSSGYIGDYINGSVRSDHYCVRPVVLASPSAGS